MFMRDWELEREILSSRGMETRSCKATMRISDTVQGLLKEEGNDYGCMEGDMVQCVRQLERGRIVGGCKAPELGSRENEVAEGIQ